MKSILITLLTLVASLGLSAQGLTADNDPSVAPVVPVQSADSVPEKKARHNSLTESYRNERLQIRKGNTFFRDSNYHRALECYERALEENGMSMVARYNKACALLKLSNSDNAGTQADTRPMARELLAGVAEDAKTQNPDLAHLAYYNLGNMSYNDSEYGMAIALYQASLRLEPDDWNARYNLRLAQLKLQQQEQNQDQQDQDQDQQDQNQDQQQQQQQQDQQQQEQEQEQQPQEQPMSQSAEQILQSMQNQENATRRRVQQQEDPAQGRRQPDKPW